MTFVVGQEVYVRRRSRRAGGAIEPAPVKVAKVGRKWVTLESGDRFELDGGQPFVLDGGKYLSPGWVWPSLMDWEIHTRRIAAWARIQAAAKFLYPPDGVMMFDLEQMAEKLEGGR